MNHPTRRAAFSLLAALVAAACGGSAFTAGESSDGGSPPVDATTEASVEAGDGAAVETGVDSGATADTGMDTGSVVRSDGAANDAGCHIGSDCSTGYCKAGVCEPCTTTGQCAMNEWCDILAGACKPTKPNGAGCAGAAECQSEFCVDGVCCNTSCSDNCEACNTQGAPGTCSPIPPGGNVPARPCPSGEVCCVSGGATSGESCVFTNTVQNCGMCGKTCTVVENGCQMPECTAGSCTVLLLTVGTACGDGGKCSGTGQCL
jgi:hypothetical protein